MFLKLILLTVNNTLELDTDASLSGGREAGSKEPALSKVETRWETNLLLWEVGRSCQAGRFSGERRELAVLTVAWANSITIASLCSKVGTFSSWYCIFSVMMVIAFTADLTSPPYRGLAETYCIRSLARPRMSSDFLSSRMILVIHRDWQSLRSGEGGSHCGVPLSVEEEEEQMVKTTKTTLTTLDKKSHQISTVEYLNVKASVL